MDDILSFPCPSCGAALKAPANAAGRRFTCRQCGQPASVPALFDETPPKPPAIMAPFPTAEAPSPATPSRSLKPVVITALAVTVIAILAFLMLGGGEAPPPPVPRSDPPAATTAKPQPAVPGRDQARPAAGSQTPRTTQAGAAKATPPVAPVPATGTAVKKVEPSRRISADLVARCAPQVVTITTDHDHTGSGFVAFAEKLVVVSFQVVSGGSAFTLHFPRTDAVPTAEAKVIAVDADNDLALLAIVDGPDDIVALPLGDERSLRAGAEVFTIGGPGQDALLPACTASLGSIASADGKVGGRQRIETTTAFIPGRSGGPLFDLEGRVVGVVTAPAQGDSRLAVPIDQAYRLYLGREGAFKVPGEFADWEARRPFDALKRHPGAIPVDDLPTSLAIDAQTGLLVALAPEHNQVLIIDTARHAIVKEVATGIDPVEIHTTNHGSAWVACTTAKTLTLIDLTSGQVQRTLPLLHEPLSFTIASQHIWFLETGGRLGVVPLQGGKPSQLTPLEVRAVTATGQSDNLLCGSMKSWLLEINGDQLLRCMARSQVIDKALAGLKDQEEGNPKVERKGATKRNGNTSPGEQRDLILREQEKTKGMLDDAVKVHRPPAEVELDPGATLQSLLIEPASRLVYYQRCAVKTGDPTRSLGVFTKPDHHLSDNKVVQDLATRYPWQSQILAISPDGRLAASGTHLFRTDDFTLLEELPIPTPAAVFAADGRTLWIADLVNKQVIGLPITPRDDKPTGR